MTGLKVNHPRQVNALEPLAFFLRRITFVAAAIFFARTPLFAVLVFLAGTLAALAFALHDQPWEDSARNRQNIFNEFIVYTIVALSLPSDSVYAHTILGLVSVVVLLNGLCMLSEATRIARLYLRRLFYRKRAEKKRVAKEELFKEINQVV